MFLYMADTPPLPPRRPLTVRGSSGKGLSLSLAGIGGVSVSLLRKKSATTHLLSSYTSSWNNYTKTENAEVPAETSVYRHKLALIVGQESAGYVYYQNFEVHHQRTHAHKHHCT